MKFPFISAKSDPKPKLPSMSIVGVPQSNFIMRYQITPDEILNARTMMHLGKLQNIMRLYDIFLLEDDSCRSALSVRSEALKSANVSFGDQKLSPKQTEYFNALIKRFYPSYCNMLLYEKLTDILFRQIAYEFKDGLYYPVRYLKYPYADIRMNQNRDVALFDGDKQVAIHPVQFILEATEEIPVLYSVLKYYVFFSFALNNWAQFTETFGKPPRIAKYKPGTTDAEKATLWEMLQNFGTDLAAMVSENVTLEFADFATKTASVDLYSRLVEFCDDRIVRAILGNTLTTKSGGGTGSYALGKVHNMVRDDILKGDCRDLASFLSAHFSMLNHINFGSEDISVTVKPPMDVNLKERIEVDVRLYNEVGIEFPEDYWYDTYGIPKP